MGKNLVQQKRGKGSPTYRTASFRFQGRASHGKTSKEEVNGEIKDLIKCPGHSCPLAKVEYENGETTLIQAPEDVRVGDPVSAGENVEVTVVFSAPLTASTYQSYWRMANPAGVNFGDFFYVDIVVR